MRFKIDPEFEGPAVEFVKTFLDLFDTRDLREFKIRRSQASGGTYKGIHGNCKPPGYPNITHQMYRISCSVSGTDADFPFKYRGRGLHAGTLRPEYVAENIQELIAWVAGHELYHFLGQPEFRHPATGQIPGRMSSERSADVMGYEFMYAVREGRDPVEVALGALDGVVNMVALERYPYTRRS